MALYGHFNAITSWEYSANMGPNKTRPLAVVAGSRNLAFAFFDMSVRTYSQFFIESSSPPAPAGWPLGGFNIWQPQWVGGGGSPKSRWKEQGCMNYVCDKGEGVNKSENVADVIYGSALGNFFFALRHLQMFTA